VEDNKTLSRIDHLIKVNCYTRFVSFEPLLEKLDNVNLKNTDWAIFGGESGPNYGMMKEKWAWILIKQCKEQKVKVFSNNGGPIHKSVGRIIKGKTFDQFLHLNKNLW